MLNSYEHYTSEKRTPHASRFLSKIAKLIVAVFVLTIILPGFFIGALSFETRSMEPVFQSGDRAAYSPLAYGALFFGMRLPGLGKPLRGDLVVIKPPWFPEKSFFQNILDPIVEFVTVRNLSATVDRRGRNISERIVLRIIGLPGETVRVQGSKLFIQSENASEFISELSLVPHQYTPKEMAAGAGDDLLFQEVTEIVVKENEYFLVGDNRALFSDSRFQGSVPFQAIQGKVFLRYWPFERFETP